MTDLASKATTLLELHQPGNPVILPTVWDAWSANLAVSAGFMALTVGSHPVSDSIGKADNEGITFDELITRIKQITDAVDVPISVDIESGYGEDPKRLIDGLLSVGAVGLNIEDTVHSEGGRLREAQEHADFVGALRAASDATDTHVVINARTDLFVKQVGDENDRVDRAIDLLTRLTPAVCAQAPDRRATSPGQRDRSPRQRRQGSPGCARCRQGQLRTDPADGSGRTRRRGTRTLEVITGRLGVGCRTGVPPC